MVVNESADEQIATEGTNLAEYDNDGESLTAKSDSTDNKVANESTDEQHIATEGTNLVDNKVANETADEQHIATEGTNLVDNKVANKSADEQHIATEGTDLADNKAPACTKRKREENSGGGTCKKIKVS
jgi:hypothetical protein